MVNLGKLVAIALAATVTCLGYSYFWGSLPTEEVPNGLIRPLFTMSKKRYSTGESVYGFVRFDRRYKIELLNCMAAIRASNGIRTKVGLDFLPQRPSETGTSSAVIEIGSRLPPDRYEADIHCGSEVVTQLFSVEDLPLKKEIIGYFEFGEEILSDGNISVPVQLVIENHSTHTVVIPGLKSPFFVQSQISEKHSGSLPYRSIEVDGSTVYRECREKDPQGGRWIEPGACIPPGSVLRRKMYAEDTVNEAGLRSGSRAPLGANEGRMISLYAYIDLDFAENVSEYAGAVPLRIEIHGKKTLPPRSIN